MHCKCSPVNCGHVKRPSITRQVFYQHKYGNTCVVILCLTLEASYRIALNHSLEIGGAHLLFFCQLWLTAANAYIWSYASGRLDPWWSFLSQWAWKSAWNPDGSDKCERAIRPQSGLESSSTLYHALAMRNHYFSKPHNINQTVSENLWRNHCDIVISNHIKS